MIVFLYLEMPMVCVLNQSLKKYDDYNELCVIYPKSYDKVP